MDNALIVDRLPGRGSSCSELMAVVVEMSNSVMAIASAAERAPDPSLRKGVINGIDRIESNLRRASRNVQLPGRSSIASSQRDAQRRATEEDGYALLPDPIRAKYDASLECWVLARDSELATIVDSDAQLLMAAERLVKKAMLLDIETKGMRLDEREEGRITSLLESSAGVMRANAARLARRDPERRIWGSRR